MTAPGLHFVTRALHWLRAGYPQGIPQQDYVALLGLLDRSLTESEVASIADDLAAHAESGSEITGNDVRRMIQERAYERPVDADVQRVTLRLVQGGWPLAGELRKEYGLTDGPAPMRPAQQRTVSAAPTDQPPGAVAAATGPGSADDDPGENGLIARLVAWLREGYPTGVPEQDYVPLLALLQRRLTSEEVTQVARALRQAQVAPAGPEDIAGFITQVTHETPSETDMERVRRRLATKGWPLELPDPSA